MPRDIEMPDGLVIFNVPDNATREQVLDAWRVARGEPPSILTRVARGVRDPVDAGAQLLRRVVPEPLARGIDALGNKLAEVGLVAPSTGVEGVDKIVSDEEERYQERGGKNVDGIDWWRIGGNVLGTLPLAPSGVGAAPTMLGRMARAAGTAAVGGAAQPVQNTENFWTEKALQTGAAAAAGGAMQPVGEAVLKAGAPIVNRAVDKLRAMGGAMFARESSEEAAVRMLKEALGEVQGGPRWEELPGAVRRQLADEVAAALRKTGAVNPDAVRRAADFRAQGIDPLRSWVSRDPAQFTREFDLAAVPGVGDPLKKARASADRAMFGAIDAQARGAGGDMYELGQKAAAGVQGAENAMKRNVDTAYEMFRQTAPDVSGNGPRLVDRISRAFDEKMVGAEERSGIIALLQKLASGEMPATPQALYQMQKMAPNSVAGGIVRREIDAELQRMGAEMGPQMQIAAGVLKAARGMAKQRFDLQDAVRAFADVADDRMEPSRFFERYILHADPKEVARMWREVSDPGAKAAMRAQMSRYLRGVAGDRSGFGDESFAAKTFANAVSGTGMRQKLEILLGRRGAEEILRTARNAHNAISHPSGATGNTSRTAGAALGHALTTLDKFPIANRLLGPSLRQSVDSMAASASGDIPAALAQRAQVLNPMDPRRAATTAGLFALPAGATAEDWWQRQRR